MTLVRTMGADGWQTVDASCHFTTDRAGKRSAANVAVLMIHEGRDFESEVTWTREVPDADVGYKNARVWRRTDSEGGKWSVEYGYDGRWWVLFGPDGSPWGELLASSLANSLIEATEYAVRVGARTPSSKPSGSAS